MVPANRRPFQVEDLLRQPRAGTPRVSPDGRSVVFTVVTPDLAQNRNTTHLWQVPVDGGTPRVLTTGGNGNREPAFAPDGRSLAFTSDRSGSGQVWVLPLDGGEARQVTRLPEGASRPLWLPDGRSLLVVSPVVLERLERPEKSSGRVADGLMFRHWDSWRDGRVDHLFLVDVETGDARDLTPGPWPVPPLSLGGDPDFAVSPDGATAWFVAVREGDLARSTSLAVWEVPVAGGTPRPVSRWAGAHNFPTPSPCGRWLAFTGMRRAGYEADLRELLVLDRETGTLREVAPGFDRSAGPPTWSPDGRWLYFSAEDQGTTRLWRVPAAGGSPEPLTAGGTDRAPAVTPDGARLVFVRESLLAPPEIWTCPASGGDARPVTALNGADLAALDLRDGEDFWWDGADGLRCHGLLVRPPAFDPSRRYPVVFVIHGGPQGMAGRDFHPRWNAQLFAAAGFVTVLLNPRGSTGFGQAFTDAIHGEWGGKCYQDLLRGFDHVLAAFPFCDPERTAAVGASFGGFMVNWIAGHTDRFRCLASHDGIFNTEMMDWATDELWFTEWEFGGAPWDSPEGYRRWSPHLHVAQMKTPMLVVQGEQDFRCPVGEGLGLFTALQRRGVPSRLLVFPDEGHWVLKPANRKLWWDTMLGWLRRWLAD